MRALTEKGKHIVLVLAKDFTALYNARSLSKQVGMTPRGALKALKNLELLGLVKGRPFGRAIIYKLIYNEHARKLLPLLFFEEAQTAARWVKDFEGFKARALIIFGSAIRGKGHNDVDLMMLIDQKEYELVQKQVEEKNALLVKPIHAVWQTRSDLEKNLKRSDPVVVEIIKSGIVLKGQEIITEVLAHVARGE